MRRNEEHDTADVRNLIDTLVKLQQQGTSSSGEHVVRYHCLREESCPNGKTRFTVLFSPTLVMKEESRSIGEELSELLLRSYLLSSTKKSAELSNTNFIVAENANEDVSYEFPIASAEQTEQANIIPSRSSAWTNERFKELDRRLKVAEPGFCLPRWLPFQESNLCAERYLGEIMDVSASVYRKFELLRTHELLWIYRRFFTSLHHKIRDIDPELVSPHLRYAQMTPPWLRTRAIIGNTIFHLPKPVRVYTLREVRSRHGLKGIKLVLAAFYKRKEHFARETLCFLLRNIPPMSFIEKEIRPYKSQAKRSGNSSQSDCPQSSNATPSRKKRSHIAPSPCSSRKSKKLFSSASRLLLNIG